MTSGFAAVSVALLTLVAILGFRSRKRRAARQATASLGSGTQVIDMSMPIAAASTDNILELRAQELITESQEEVPQQSAQSAPHIDSIRSRGWWSSSSQNLLPATVCFSTSPGDEDKAGTMGTEAISKAADLNALLWPKSSSSNPRRKRAADRIDSAARSLETFRPSEVFRGGFANQDD